MSLPASGGPLAFWRAVGRVLYEPSLLQGRAGSGSDLREVWATGLVAVTRCVRVRVCARACECR